MSDTIKLSAEPRSDVGKGASRRLRRLSGMVPGIVYGGGEEPRKIALSANELSKAEKHEAFYSQILELRLDGDASQVLLKDLQRHPSREEIIHVDLLRVRADQEVTTLLPIHLAGEEECRGVTESGGQITHQTTEIEITCLPGKLPEYLELDVSALDLGETLHLSDIPLPEGVRIPSLDLGEDHDQAVVGVIEVRVREEEEPADEEDAAPDEESAGEEGESSESGEASSEGDEGSDED